MQVQLLKREHFNRWYRINPYYFAMSLAKLPVQILNSFLYLTMVYLMTGKKKIHSEQQLTDETSNNLYSDQPVEFKRMVLFYLISILTSLTSESFGLLISARLSVIVSALNY